MTAEEAFALIKDDLKLVEETLIKRIDTSVPLINEVVSYLLTSGGKRLRPAFVALSSRMCGYTGVKSVMMATVIEYIHTATLLHDDVIDGAKYRRSRPSANGIYGNDIAVLCGDFLYSRGYTTLTEYGDKATQELLASTAKIMSEGEVVQLSRIADVTLTLDEYVNIIFCKTAALFSAACETGGRIAGAEEPLCVALADFGKYAGLAFQMSDDILDYMGRKEETGKDPGTDFREGKLTLPVILLLKEADETEKNSVFGIFSDNDRTETDLERITDLMIKYDVSRKAEDVMHETVDKSMAALDVFPASPYKEALKALASALVHRQR